MISGDLELSTRKLTISNVPIFLQDRYKVVGHKAIAIAMKKLEVGIINLVKTI